MPIFPQHMHVFFPQVVTLSYLEKIKNKKNEYFVRGKLQSFIERRKDCGADQKMQKSLSCERGEENIYNGVVR